VYIKKIVQPFCTLFSVAMNFHIDLPQDLIKTANLLFSQLDSAYVWTVCGRHFSAACAAQAGSESTAGAPVQPVGSESTNIPEICELVSFLLDIVSIETYVETSSEHLPRFFRQRSCFSIQKTFPTVPDPLRSGANFGRYSYIKKQRKSTNKKGLKL
jgi:hypothetical protein